jgi:hypothetical protein
LPVFCAEKGEIVSLFIMVIAALLASCGGGPAPEQASTVQMPQPVKAVGP